MTYGLTLVASFVAMLVMYFVGYNYGYGDGERSAKLTLYDAPKSVLPFGEGE